MKTIMHDFGIIRIGENASENWTLLSNAKQTDLWFHVKNAPSAYVIMTPLESISQSNILECAKLAKQHSRLKHSHRCKISWTEAKNVKRGSQTGEAITRNIKEVVV
eukprot:c26798_g1_i1.p1 GENE.c26798_g1_i1~~c26798_g1_i1.p1  ORF type:complete len:106 (-),score=13.08 c26798_g1_i1:67-384(-)